ncbi:hypothetical protein HYALB_00003107 [Hymenoscyphus albidus]|uniref:Uncharacterized protein n=1 Tax=Hymenoscyphus albidus TaxID=595503 RepID=A0A9N9Q1F7_9HELO|nr:hypothetical protein HYALB_00003107 [Hymenoscyphus albidus]
MEQEKARCIFAFAQNLQVGVTKSSLTGEGTKNIATANTSNSKKMFRRRRKMGRGDLESLGNTFDMQDTVNDTGAKAHVSGEDIRLVRLKQINSENGRETPNTHSRAKWVQIIYKYSGSFMFKEISRGH